MLPKKKKKREEIAVAHWCFKVCSPYSKTIVEALLQRSHTLTLPHIPRHKAKTNPLPLFALHNL
jgi:hypothetical protein